MKKQTMAAFLTMVLGLFQPGLAELRAQGQQEGIKVHGHWTIDVREADGTLVMHREFENALRPNGGVLLAAMLSKGGVPGLWSIVIGPATSSQARPCTSADPFGNGSGVCVITDPQVSLGGVNGDSLVLNGTVTAAFTSQIGRVASGIGSCPRSVLVGACTATAPTDYAGFIGGDFTVAMLASPISVVAGQIIQVTVVFSFS